MDTKVKKRIIKKKIVIGYACIKKITLLAAVAAMLPNTAFAAPSITSTSSANLSHSQTITVNGSGFGVKSPVAPQMWDPVDGMYTNIVNGAVVPIGSSYVWPNSSGSSPPLGDTPRFKTSNPRGKYTAKYTNTGTTGGDGRSSVGGKDFSLACAGGKMYVTWWIWTNSSAPQGTGESSKFNRFTNNGNDSNLPSQILWKANNLQAYDTTLGYVINSWPGWTGNTSAWNRLEEVVDNTTTPKPNVKGSVNGTLALNATASISLPVDICGISSIGYDASNDSGTPIFDYGEIYVDNTLARVEICNATTKAASNHCEIQIPQTIWVDGQLQITVNQGSFASGATAYLYVIDNTGTVSNGQPITFGSGSTALAAPTGLKVGSVQ